MKKEGTVFIHYRHKRTSELIVLNCDTVLVGRNPSLHPGDLRFLYAVDVPHLHHLGNVIVFPCKGERTHPTEMSGGDLDGDIYLFAVWEKNLFPSHASTPTSSNDLIGSTQIF